MRSRSNKKGQVYIIAVIIAIVFALISSFILINYASSEKSTDEFIGVYQSGMIDAILDGDKTLMYLEQVAKFSSDDALQDFADNGGVSIYNEQQGEKTLKCKTYVYNLWNSESADCFPDYKESLIQYMYNSMIPRFNSNPDVNLQKETPFKFRYGTSSMQKSTISGLSDIQYEYYVFKSREYKENPDVQNYIDNKRIYSDGNSYTVGTGNCQDVVTFADKYVGAPYSSNTNALSPDDAKRIGLQCGAFVTSVFKFGSSMAAPMGNGNQKCYNFQTNTASPTVEMIYKRSTDFNCMSNLNCVKGLVPLTKKELDDMKLSPGDIFSSTSPTTAGLQYGHTGIYVGKGRLETPISGNGWVYKKFIPDPNGEHVAIHSGTIGYSYISDLEAHNRKMIAFCRPKGCITDKNPVNTVNCQVKSNSDWKITNIQAIPKLVSGEQTVTILTTIENPGSECASVAGRPKIGAPNQNDYVVNGEKKTDVYKDNAGNTFKNVETKCTFITDKNKLTTERGVDKCVLLAPTDGSKIKYTVTAGAIDANSRYETDSKTTTFEVTAPQAAGTGGTGGQTTPFVQLTESQKRNIETTKKNLESAKILQYIIDTANKENVPPEIVLGLVTQESKGIIGAKSPTGATGLFQVIRSYHEARVKSECGSWDNFKTDAQCQVRVGIGILKQYYQQYSKKGLPMKCTCEGNKGTTNCKPIDTTYTGWDAALRAYNNAGCAVWADYNFVETVMTYASGWGYSGTVQQVEQYQQVAIDEIEGKGIIGKYYVNPSFTVNIPFDLSLVDNLSLFMNQTVNECRISQLGKEPCLNSKIAEFNTATGALYKSNGINIELTRNCDESTDEKNFNEFIESVEDCAMSPDFDCQCDLRKSSSIKVNVESSEESALFSFTKSGITYDVTSYNKFLDAKNDPLKLSASINSIGLYKKLGYLKSGVSGYKLCSVPESRFRLCLKTDYHTSEYDGRSLSEKNVTLKFAVTIKDNDAPPPLTNVQLSNMKNSRNSVIVMFDESKKNGVRVPDVASYNIYISDVAADFNNDIQTIHQNVKYRTLDILNTGYDKISGLDLTKDPVCELVDDKYCKFNYTAKDANGIDAPIEIFEDKLYYLTDTEQFFYILNGSDSYNALNSGRDKYIAVTAVDTDGNEIDNVDTLQKITQGQNLQNIIPVDNLAPGFVQITVTVNTVTNSIHLTYERPLFYVNGEAMDNTPILYRAYSDWNTCSQTNPDFCDVKIPYNHIAETGGLTMDVDRTMIYRIGVIPLITKNNIDAQYISAFTETIVAP